MKHPAFSANDELALNQVLKDKVMPVAVSAFGRGLACIVLIAQDPELVAGDQPVAMADGQIQERQVSCQ
ncbi:hypothetical protein D3C76_1691680 [compost metagenome]